ncbi:uncharacterized protein G6M90_00g080370 [Metarhizium brunneum]|uniref:Uncharacterized protein n=1 Tax=Metarhizium brunneum TaxID=500148 RepID=A0A7D5Z483_9HYPO|nr:hypothetical protein G6M90_00g080370 [Metarhizium brunneum]
MDCSIQIDSFDDDTDDISSAPPPSDPSNNSTSSAHDPSGFPDYQTWTTERFKRFPNFIICHDPSREQTWWWKYGFSMKDHGTEPHKIV